MQNGFCDNKNDDKNTRSHLNINDCGQNVFYGAIFISFLF